MASNPQKPVRSIDRLRHELDAVIGEARSQAEQARRWTRIWGVVDLLTGIPAAVLAAISGITGLASTTGRVTAAILALAAAAFAATATFLQGAKRRDQCNQRRRAWRALEGDARLACAYHLQHEDGDAMYAALRELMDRRRAILNYDYKVVLEPTSPPA